MALKFNFNKGYNTPIEEVVSDIDEYFYKRTRSIEEILIWATEHDCSDVYIKAFDKPYISRYGKIRQLPCTEITKDMWHVFYDKYVLNELNADYVRRKLLDISVEVRIPDDSPNFGKFDNNFYRYRASFGFSNDKNICTFRMIRPNKPTFDTINYPKQCEEALHSVIAKRSGILLFCGPTGSGKSTTLAACINTFTQAGDILDNKVIITLEDPIENDFLNTPSVKITQKELERDFKDFATGIKAALREHPNMIVVGECRDKEVICAAIEACRTGHSTVSSFHSSNVGGTVSRLLYHLDNDKNLSYDLITNLNMIMCQRLIPSDTGYIVDTQYMIFNDVITKTLLDIVDRDLNVAVEINKLMLDEELQREGAIKNWEYDVN